MRCVSWAARYKLKFAVAIVWILLSLPTFVNPIRTGTFANVVTCIVRIAGTGISGDAAHGIVNCTGDSPVQLRVGHTNAQPLDLTYHGIFRKALYGLPTLVFVKEVICHTLGPPYA